MAIVATTVALAPLATAADLPAKWATAANVDRALAVASAAVRDAAESSISEVVATISLSAPQGRTLSLPGFARNITAVTVAGTAVTDYSLVGNALWRKNGWGLDYETVTVSATFGLPAVPDDIIDLTAQLAVSWLQHDADGGGSIAGVVSAGVEDARETYSPEMAGQVSPTFIPEATRLWLRSRFSGGASVVDAS